ncbi:MAG: MBL fold metallo-hydrolase [Prosthecobacter sp.]|uniref:MBL fold metallo-hydrolase n=1 Tax=Prosthecobacter sp. TaxID=1965333 RepID=UPI001A016746|nr:MBL fold metallo-hydrolase [Prosthecobacter sp.]MBE2286658.1 MBL fold metallo-hydrolase [Prosthecobacter sp.]
MKRLLAAFALFPVMSHAALEEVAPGLFVSKGTCNTYILRDGDAALVIDPGDANVLEQIGVKDVEQVLLTGHHRELLQGIQRLDRSITKVAAPKEEQELFETPTAFRKWHPRLGDKFSVHGSSYVRPPAQPVKVDRWVADGDVIEWHGRTIRCVSTPGHSPGGTSYVWEDKVFLGGVMHDGAKMTNWFDTEWDYGFAKGLVALMGSVDRLIALKPATAFSSQGPVIAKATEQLSEFKTKLADFRPDYVRGYPVNDLSKRGPHPATKPTKAHYIVQVSPHLYMFGPEMAGKNFAILIADTGHALLLDCGLFPKLVLERIISDMKEHLGLKQIDACWISHSHGDHFTLFPALQDHGVKFWTMGSIADKCENPRFYDYPAMIGAYNAGFEKAKIDRVLKAGDVIEWEGYQLHIDWMPGQTEFGNALWLMLDGKKVVFTGDNLFGDPSDPAQNGHECVNARNSAIIEEGYLVAAKYLQKLQPDIIMGAHGVLMTEPKAFIDRYHDWALRAISKYKALLPDADYEYGFDPYWVSAYPYRVDLTKEDTQVVQVTVRNFRDRPQKHRVVLKTPPGIVAVPNVLEGSVAAKSRESFPVTLKVQNRNQQPAGVQIVPFDITLDGRQHGELFDFILMTQEPVKIEATKP